MLQSYIPFLPDGAEPMNNHVAIYRCDGKIEFYTASGPIYSCRENDLYGLRLAQGIIVSQTATTPAEIARALNVNSTVYRNLNRYQQDGAAGLIINRSNRSGYKLNGKINHQVQSLLDKGCSLKGAASQVGVTEGCIRYAIKKGILVKNRNSEIRQDLKSASQRSVEDSNCAIGIGAKREGERVLASIGKISEAAPEFSASEGVQFAGVLLALPALAKVGLLEAGAKVYGTLHNGFYGLQSVLLTLAFMAFLRIKTPEQLKRYNPGELGIILGLDRAPEVKTLRKKIMEMGLRDKAGEFFLFYPKDGPKKTKMSSDLPMWMATYVSTMGVSANCRKRTLPEGVCACLQRPIFGSMALTVSHYFL